MHPNRHAFCSLARHRQKKTAVQPITLDKTDISTTNTHKHLGLVFTCTHNLLLLLFYLETHHAYLGLMTGIPRYFCKSCLKVCREEADLIGDGREFQRRVLVKSGEVVPGVVLHWGCRVKGRTSCDLHHDLGNHLCNIMSKSRWLLGLLKRNRQALSIIYMLYIHPQLEYGQLMALSPRTRRIHRSDSRAKLQRSFFCHRLSE